MTSKPSNLISITNEDLKAMEENDTKASARKLAAIFNVLTITNYLIEIGKLPSQHLCRGVKSPTTSVLDMTLN